MPSGEPATSISSASIWFATSSGRPPRNFRSFGAALGLLPRPRRGPRRGSTRLRTVYGFSQLGGCATATTLELSLPVNQRLAIRNCYHFHPPAAQFAMALTTLGKKQRHSLRDARLAVPHCTGVGRPSKYKPEYCNIVELLGRQGKSPAQMARFSTSTAQASTDGRPFILISRRASRARRRTSKRGGRIRRSATWNRRIFSIRSGVPLWLQGFATTTPKPSRR